MALTKPLNHIFAKPIFQIYPIACGIDLIKPFLMMIFSYLTICEKEEEEGIAISTVKSTIYSLNHDKTS